MFGEILTIKVAAAILAGAAVVTGGAAIQSTAALHADRSSAPATDTSASGKGQGDLISSLAHSTLGGPGKGAVISTAAKTHGLTVSAEARANAKR
jgi:hypothetical protein